jgi:hypothetical protein
VELLFRAGSRENADPLWLVKVTKGVGAGPVKVVTDEAKLSSPAVVLLPGMIEATGEGISLEAITTLLPTGVIIVMIDETLVAEIIAPRLVVPTAIEIVSTALLLVMAVDLESIGSSETELLGVAT